MAQPDLLVLAPSASSGEIGEPAMKSKSRLWQALWLECRPSQWIKNLFVCIPVFFSQELLVAESAGRTFAALGLFCAVSSSVYILNDLFDREQDRLHPEKRDRPLTSGLLTPWVAQVTMVGLLLIALAGGVTLSKPFAAILAIYWGLNFLYAVQLKHHVIVDVFVIAAGYLLRVIGGAVVIGAAMSHWLLICTTLVALFIVLCKRRHELVLLEANAQSHRQVLVDYPLPFLDMMIGVLTAAAVVSYSLFTVSEEIMQRLHHRGLLITAPFVLYGFFRYLYLVFQRAEGGDPTQSLLMDRPMLVNLALWAMATAFMLYWRPGF